MTKAVERLTVGVQQLADLLGLTMPDLPTSATLSKGGLQIVENTSSFTVREEGSEGIWDDDEERRFYEELPDLKDFVPSSLLGIKNKEKKDGQSQGQDEKAGDVHEEMNEDEEKQRLVEEDIKRQLEQITLDDAGQNETGVKDEEDDQARIDDPTEPSTEPIVVGEEEGLQSGPAARLTALFAAMPEAVNREMIDKLAVEFGFLNSKAARKRLIKVR